MANWYVPGPVTQRNDADKCQWSNCWAAVGVWLVDAATGGGKTPTIPQLKQKVGGTAGGLNPDTKCPRGLETDLVRGLKAFGVIEFGRHFLSRDEAFDLLAEPRRRAYALAVDYAAWPADKDCQHGLVDEGVNHMVGILPGLGPGKKNVEVMNPLCVDPSTGKPRMQKVGLAAILDAAVSFMDGHSRDELVLVGVKRPAVGGAPEHELVVEDLRETVAEQRLAMRRAERALERALGG